MNFKITHKRNIIGGANVAGGFVGGANVGGAIVGGAIVGGANVGGAIVGGVDVLQIESEWEKFPRKLARYTYSQL